jgi:hypothetical protein
MKACIACQQRASSVSTTMAMETPGSTCPCFTAAPRPDMVAGSIDCFGKARGTNVGCDAGMCIRISAGGENESFRLPTVRRGMSSCCASLK